MPAAALRARRHRSGETSLSTKALAPAAPEPPPGSFRRPFWLLYAVGWLPLAGVYALVFAATGYPPGQAVRGAAGNVLPLALLGAAALPLWRRLARRPRRRLALAAGHLGLAAAYAVAATAGSHLLFLLDRWAGGARPDFAAIDLRVAVWQLFLALLVYSTLATLVYALRAADRLRREEARAAHAEALRAQAELRALRARLNPHFLFNTLHTLLALVRRDPAAAEEALEQLGDLLRYVLQVQGDGGEEVPLADEWEFVANYLALERLRLGDRLVVDARSEPGALACRVPAFCLQPLVENAVRHAVAPRAGAGRIEIAARRDGGALALEVRDDGPGADAAAVAAASGSGLRLVRRRLATLYGGRAALSVDTAPGAGFAVTVRLPAAAAGAPP